MAFKQHMFKMMLASLEKATHCLILLQKTNKHHHSCRFCAALTELALDKVFVLPLPLLLPALHISKPIFYAWLLKSMKAVFLSG